MRVALVDIDMVIFMLCLDVGGRRRSRVEGMRVI